ncbi:MAG: hypothetical protein CO031_03020 [Candidatus Nealsonbacteria bacterium CG_4_9_14_0_2_um_filter_37_38]|uniref:Uncharacterized protein n=1 Tax=Candidatus Nealsonbacteria bacterium CG_4_10_14_0_8_um_filter_37_14 TaxID=1974684 RepID=A0A2M7R692_9BACT|nr:MAG: hypothetical protein COY73_02835 [Candidatus Nealsonbacteria bacterium CG_4_10_14_0_8_um_filter_37_14]PJC51358.1 MAG: hypothetical protein CO031_03020 [Candidatus Nealsonbacteria bacterium CG_4_9_14_0_2_um_filter_37_38]
MKNLFKDEKTSPWIVLIISFLVMILIIQILSWQYHRIAKEEISLLEIKVEKAIAGETLKDFMEARITKNKSQATILLTERAMEQVSRGEIELMDNFQSFEILETTQLGENGFNFLVKIQFQNGTEMIELIKTTKILDKYYIDSIQLPG